MDLLTDAREELVTRLLTAAPPGYRARVCIIAALWSLLFLQSLVFVVLSYRDARRKGKGIKLIRLQKTARGTLLSVQAMHVFALATVVMSILAVIRQAIIYKCYFEGADRYLETVFYVVMLTAAVWGAFAYTFSHLNAAILLFGTSAHDERTKIIWIPIYNVSLIVLPLVWLGIIISQGVRIVVSEKKMFKAAKTVLPLLDSVIADPTTLTANTLGQLTSLQNTIYSNLPKVIAQRKGLCILAIVYSCIFGMAGTAGLWLIHTLKASTKSNTELLYASHNRRGSAAATGPASFALPGRGVVQAFNSPMSPASAMPHTPQLPGHKWDEETSNLQKLLSNLQMSVPLCLVLAIYFPVALGVLYAKGTDDGWRWEELRNDIFTWPWSIIMNIIFACFHFNAWKGKKRYDSNSASSAAVRSGSIQRAKRTQSSGHHVLSVELESAYPPTSPKEAELAAQSDDQNSKTSTDKQGYTWA